MDYFRQKKIAVFFRGCRALVASERIFFGRLKTAFIQIVTRVLRACFSGRNDHERDDRPHGNCVSGRGHLRDEHPVQVQPRRARVQMGKPFVISNGQIQVLRCSLRTPFTQSGMPLLAPAESKLSGLASSFWPLVTPVSTRFKKSGRGLALRIVPGDTEPIVHALYFPRLCQPLIPTCAQMRLRSRDCRCDPHFATACVRCKGPECLAAIFGNRMDNTRLLCLSVAQVVVITTLVCIALFAAVMAWLRYKRLIGV